MEPTTITLEVDFFDHLLNCMANQKYIHNMSADALGESGKEIRKIQEDNQRVIDEAYHKARELLSTTNDA